jgi:peptidoglycan hydrolase-like amidase
VRSNCWLLLFALCLAGRGAQAQDVRIGVFGIFHPHELTLSCTNGEVIVVTIPGRTIFLHPRSPNESLQIRVANSAMVLNINGGEVQADGIHAAGRDGGAARFVLAVPGKINRKYLGVLDLKAVDEELIPIITMDLETAVASVVQAESALGTPLEALKAQAVVTRSYFVAGSGRHSEFDFCDLTHCQFLREPPPKDSPAALATAATKGSIISFEEKPVAAMFTRSCGGATRTPADIGIPTKDYPYFSVRCDFCTKNPVRWTRSLSPQDAALLKEHSEAARLAVDRRLGWNAVPSNTFAIREGQGEMVLNGVGQGHGIGLCQRGARAMAEQGADFRKIIDHYFPNTNIVQLATRPPGNGR